MFRPYVAILVLTALALFLVANSSHAKTVTKKRARPPVVQAAMGFQPPSAGAACRSAYETCLSECPGGDTCAMDCETDCSICALEETGDIDVDSKVCRR